MNTNSIGTRRAGAVASTLRFLNRHWEPVMAVAALLVLAVAVWGITALVGTINHAIADGNYQDARVRAVVQYKAGLEAQRMFGTTRTEASELADAVKTIRADGVAGGFLPAEQLALLEVEAANLTTYAGSKPGPPVVDPHPAGTGSSTTAQLNAETRRLTTLTNTQRAAHKLTANDVKGIRAQIHHTTTVLTGIITGVEASATVEAVQALDLTAANVIAAHSGAAQDEKDALTASVVAAKESVKNGKAPAPGLVDYLAKAKALSGPHLRMITDSYYRHECTVGQVIADTDWTLGLHEGEVSWHGTSASVPWSYSRSGNILKVWLCR